jgi:hypothetical protein
MRRGGIKRLAVSFTDTLELEFGVDTGQNLSFGRTFGLAFFEADALHSPLRTRGS